MYFVGLNTLARKCRRPGNLGIRCLKKNPMKSEEAKVITPCTSCLFIFLSFPLPKSWWRGKRKMNENPSIHAQATKKGGDDITWNCSHKKHWKFEVYLQSSMWVAACKPLVFVYVDFSFECGKCTLFCR